jgi:hypothetical protein
MKASEEARIRRCLNLQMRKLTIKERRFARENNALADTFEVQPGENRRDSLMP